MKIQKCGNPRTGEMHPEPLPTHRIRLDCMTANDGVPDCYGAAAHGPTGCTCDTLSEEDHARCVADAWRAFRGRAGAMCHDCAFRKGSPEQEQIPDIAAQGTPFRCHQGMPVDARGGSPHKDAYCPKLTDDNQALDYPICAGWWNAYAARHNTALGAKGG